jgi:hypothetical protein
MATHRHCLETAMTRFVEVSHEEWIAAPEAVVRSQFADLRHHISARVHPKLRFEVLADGPQGARFVQELRLLGIRQRDVFLREHHADGSMTDTSIEGFNRGGTITFRFRGATRSARPGTLVRIEVRLPLPPLVGGLIRPLLAAQVRRELLAAAAEDKHDIEVRGYRPAAAADVVMAA